MRITFVVPNLDLGGGTLVVVKYANQLAARGHNVTIVALHKHQFTTREYLRLIIRQRRPLARIPTIEDQSRNVTVKLTTATRIIDGSALPTADILIATWWLTMEWISQAGPEKGTKIHFIQGYEVFPYLPQDRSHAVLNLPCPKIVVSKWLENIMKNTYGAKDIHLIENGVDINRFEVTKRARNAVPIFGFVYSSVPCKNVKLAIDSLQMLRAKKINFQAVSFGSEASQLPTWIEYHRNLRQELIPQIYARCDAWLFTSTSEGFGLPILEAMASRTPVIATPAGAAPELVNEQNGQLVDFSVDSVSAAIERVASLNDAEWLALSDNAHLQAKKNSWPIAFEKMEMLLRTYC